MPSFNLRFWRGEERSSLENPAVPLSSVALEGFGQLSSNDTGEAVTQDRSLIVPTVYRCVSLISSLIAGCPLVVYKNPGKKSVTVPALDPVEHQHPLYAVRVMGTGDGSLTPVGVMPTS